MISASASAGAFFIVCRTAEVVWHMFFIANPKMFITFALATLKYQNVVSIFSCRMYIPRKIDDCPVYGAIYQETR